MLRSLGIDLSQFPTWTLYVLGGGLALVVLMIVLSLVSGRRRRRTDRPKRGAFKNIYQGGGSFVERAGDDRRRAARRTGNPINVLVSKAASGVNPVEAVVVDRSEGGVRLSVGTNFPLGSTVYVKPALAPEDLAFIAAEVKYCQPVPSSGFHVGCQFVEKPPMKILLLFG